MCIRDSERSEERRLRTMVSSNRERSQKYVTVETKSRDLREDRGLRLRVVGVVCEFHVGEQVLPVLLETSDEAWRLRAARLPLRRDYYYITFDHESSTIDVNNTMEAI